jgi:hypothetical protein
LENNRWRKNMNIGIFTNFQDANVGHSLIGIVLDQCKMLLEHGNIVHLYVSEQFKSSDYERIERHLGDSCGRFWFHKIVPFGHLTDYPSMISWTKEHQYLSVKVGQMITDQVLEHNLEVCFTHDWIFTGWNLPYAGGIRFATVLNPNVGWLHWVHSVPSGMRDWWRLELYGNQHRIIFPNVTDQRRVAEQYRTYESSVWCIPHIKDLRVWFDMCDETNEIIKKFPALMSSEMVQIYPASSDRLEAKGLSIVIEIFGNWVKHGISACLIVANQWATKSQENSDLRSYEEMATKHGLVVGETFMFTSEIEDRYEGGISPRVLRELQLLSNVFIFPTLEESFGLVGPEAVYSGCIPVLNNSLPMMKEIFGHTGLYFDFGSYVNRDWEPETGWTRYLEAVAMVVYQKYMTDSITRAKSFCRKRYNRDSLYSHYYLPALKSIERVAKACRVTEEEQQEVLDAIVKFSSEFVDNKN